MLLHQVLHDDPRPPHSLNDRVPKDLETICLKCLVKEPSRRYPTAGAFADDLRRFLKGEPILARPVRNWELALKWAKRRPAAAALIIMTSVAAMALVGTIVGFLLNTRLQLALDAETAAKLVSLEAQRREQNQLYLNRVLLAHAELRE